MLGVVANWQLGLPRCGGDARRHVAEMLSLFDVISIRHGRSDEQTGVRRPAADVTA